MSESSAAKEVIFHVGLPKTGTSALQVFLAKNAPALKKKSIDYLELSDIGLGKRGQISSGNGAHLARSLYAPGHPMSIGDPDKQRQQFFDALKRSDCDRAIVSSELFADADRDQLRELVEKVRVSGYATKVIFYVRPQVQHLNSAYMQQVKRHGCTESPDEFISRTYKDSKHMKLFSFFSDMQSIFGDESVTCRLYDPKQVGIVGDFLTATRIDSDELELEISDTNTSLPPKQLGIMLLLNQFKPLMRFSDLVVENAVLTGSASAGMHHSLISPELEDEIEAHFAEGNSLLAQHYFGRDQLFPAQQRVPKASISIDALTKEDLVTFFGGLLVRNYTSLAYQEDRLSRLEKRLNELERNTPSGPA